MTFSHALLCDLDHFSALVIEENKLLVTLLVYPLLTSVLHSLRTFTDNAFGFLILFLFMIQRESRPSGSWRRDTLRRCTKPPRRRWRTCSSSRDTTLSSGKRRSVTEGFYTRGREWRRSFFRNERTESKGWFRRLLRALSVRTCNQEQTGKGQVKYGPGVCILKDWKCRYSRSYEKPCQNASDEYFLPNLTYILASIIYSWMSLLFGTQ